LGVVAELCDDVVVMYAGQTVESGPMASVLNHPAHPYTRALLACHPDMARKLVGIPGSVPSALHPPPGCRFSPRCSHATSDCGRRGARWSQVANGHLANCILYDAAENDAATQ
ncbi:MAG: oligopeptide/dipeptide ABC transporter ATP-binding protein, partial [Pseudorhodoplanes sp.]